MASLVPCVACNRHIRVDHGSCPFCAAVVPEGFASRAIPGTTRRLDRLATFTFATALTVASCGGIDDGSSGGAGAGNGNDKQTDNHADAGGFAQPYGVPIPVDGGARDAARDGATKRDAGTVDDSGAIGVMYGIAADSGGMEPPYGLPPMDAGAFDE